MPEDGIERVASEVAGHDLGDFFARYVHGTEDPPIQSALADFGVEYRLRIAQNASDRGGKPASGALPRSALNAKVGADMKLLTVYAGGAAERAGLAGRDQLVALDGLKANVETAERPAGAPRAGHAAARARVPPRRAVRAGARARGPPARHVLSDAAGQAGRGSHRTAHALPVALTDFAGGHGMGSPKRQAVLEHADVLAVLFWQPGDAR